MNNYPDDQPVRLPSIICSGGILPLEHIPFHQPVRNGALPWPSILRRALTWRMSGPQKATVDLQFAFGSAGRHGQVFNV
jgi:hypothetical protein